MAQKQIFHVSEDCKKYKEFSERFEEATDERLRYYAAIGERLLYVGMWRFETPHHWLAHVFLASDKKTKVFLSINKTVFLNSPTIGSHYSVKHVKAKVYVLE